MQSLSQHIDDLTINLLLNIYKRDYDEFTIQVVGRNSLTLTSLRNRTAQHLTSSISTSTAGHHSGAVKYPSHFNMLKPLNSLSFYKRRVQPFEEHIDVFEGLKVPWMTWYSNKLGRITANCEFWANEDTYETMKQGRTEALSNTAAQAFYSFSNLSQLEMLQECVITPCRFVRNKYR